MPSHHAETADYARGEMDARAESDPVFFEKYFGASPTQGPAMIRPALKQHQHRGHAVHSLPVEAARRPAAVLLGARIDFRRRDRQPYRPHNIRPCDRFPGFSCPQLALARLQCGRQRNLHRRDIIRR